MLCDASHEPYKRKLPSCPANQHLTDGCGTQVHVDDVSTRQILLVLMLGASSAFATPIGYQTNLIVARPGGYRFSDFFLLGGPLTLIVSAMVATMTYCLPIDRLA